MDLSNLYRELVANEIMLAYSQQSAEHRTFLPLEPGRDTASHSMVAVLCRCLILQNRQLSFFTEANTEGCSGKEAAITVRIPAIHLTMVIADENDTQESRL